jgi:octaprenyl-diphosphate synthase
MQPQKKPATAPSLDALYALIQHDLKRVDECILSRVAAQVPMIHDVAKHIIASGGKRIRPAITLIAAQLCGYQGEKHIHLAAAVELLHTATLLHDDVVDESDLRRGLPTANETFGNKASILVGDFLLSQAFVLMASDGEIGSLKLLADASAVISRGEVLQLMHQNDVEVSEDSYREILMAKTAALFATAAELGAVIINKPAERAALKEYGTAIGMAFQLVDDALDYSADQNTLGKTVGDDFREGKITMPVLIAYRDGSTEEKAFWSRTMGDLKQTPEDLAKATALLTAHKAIARTIEIASAEADKAKNALNSFKDSPAKAAMRDLADFCIARAY